MSCSYVDLTGVAFLFCHVVCLQEESLFVGGVRNLLTLYEFSFNRQTCLTYLSNLVFTAVPEDKELVDLVAVLPSI